MFRVERNKMWKSRCLNVYNIILKPRYCSTKPSRKEDHETMEKLVKVAIIGVPNVGKSTFINQIMQHRVRIRLKIKLNRSNH